MGRRKPEPDPEPEPRSAAAGACVLVVLVGLAVAVLFAVSKVAAVLALWVAGGFLLWRSARRMSDSSATPPPRGVAPESDEAARRRLRKARGVMDPNGVMCIYHATAEEVTKR
jgi:hypothetical protein